VIVGGNDAGIEATAMSVATSAMRALNTMTSLSARDR
jgi:hypothetical protein